MNTFTLNINGKSHTIEAEPDMPLLWVLRDLLGLTGTKYSCGSGYCGTCTVLKDSEAIRSCVTPLSIIGSAKISTIEGLSSGNKLHPVQQAWIDEQVPQCGYCQTGQIMSAIALLTNNPNPTDKDIDNALSGNLCRCGTYPRIRKAIHLAAKHLNNATTITDPAVNTNTLQAEVNV